MGLVYSSGDSSKLMSAMSSNLSTAKTTVSDLRSGSQRLTAAVDGRTLSGAAYNAGKGLFSELILPTISRVTTSMDGIQNDLVKYTGANAAISSEGFLDEDKLNMQMQLLKASKAALSASANAAGNLAAGNPVPGLKDMLKHAQNRLNRMANSMQDDIDKVQKKIKKLHDFSSQTNGLFSNSLNELSIAMQGVLVLSGTTVNSDGSYSLPKGTDKSWFTSKKDASAMKNSPSYAVANMPKNMTPKEAENWLIENLKKFGPDFLDHLKDGSELAEAGISFRNGRTFLNGIAISQDALGRLKWGDRFLFKPTQNGGFTYKWGKDLKNKSGIDLSEFHYSRLPDGGMNYAELKAAGWNGFKESFNPANDFKGWGDASKVGKFGKGLGILGTTVTVGNNFADNIDLSDGLGVGETVNFLTDTAIDVGSGAGATAVGAMVGSAFLPPLGTVVGAAVGVGINTAINWKFGGPPKKSTVDHVKDGVKNATKAVGDWVGGFLFGNG
ncbi:hypothetical protein CI088_12140 [Enterococcus plantarum]|uniref:LXG domain-containing protein n=1 Tax=Enterococcus plantarum TaxID=1077675 RepID=A0A2W3YV77_9ENTE|nr:T7SS effector LXG polymorphic toxin [Enterococcus plantarum]PZL71491.1 hypothetical protein CI088_12140 [Enterococcus plantarum]